MSNTEQRWNNIVNEDNNETAKTRQRNYIAMILDRSSSMSLIRQATIDAFNAQIHDIRESTDGKAIDVFVSLVTFADSADEPIFWNRPLSDVNELTLEDYKPHGMTAMHDGVGFTIQKLAEDEMIDDENTSVLVIVLSDGAENVSQFFTSQQLANLITEKQNTGHWTFVYEGANQDLTEVSINTNIPMGNTFTFTTNTTGVANLSAARSIGTRNYYTSVSNGEVNQSMNFYDDPGRGVPELVTSEQDIIDIFSTLKKATDGLETK